MPRWDTADERARLDVATLDARQGQIYADVTLVDSVFPGATSRAMRSLERREKQKHRRYPGPGLYPFVLDTRGRWGREARAFVMATVGNLPRDERVAAVQACRRMVAVALQTRVAEQLLTAASRAGVGS